MQLQQITKETPKIHSFIKAFEKATRSGFVQLNINEMKAEHGVSCNHIVDAMIKSRMIESAGSNYKWIGRMPQIADALLLEDLNEDIAKSKVNASRAMSEQTDVYVGGNKPLAGTLQEAVYEILNDMGRLTADEIVDVSVYPEYRSIKKTSIGKTLQACMESGVLLRDESQRPYKYYVPAPTERVIVSKDKGNTPADGTILKSILDLLKSQGASTKNQIFDAIASVNKSSATTILSNGVKKGLIVKRKLKPGSYEYSLPIDDAKTSASIQPAVVTNDTNASDRERYQERREELLGIIEQANKELNAIDQALAAYNSLDAAQKIIDSLRG